MYTKRGFTLIEALIVIAVMALLSGLIFAALTSSKKKARDGQRLQNARQIAIALEQYEGTNNTYKIQNAGLSSNYGSGYVVKGAESSGYTNSILSTLKTAGFYTSDSLRDPIFGNDNYYLGLCTSTNAYNVYVKLEQPQYSNATSSIANFCGGPEAAAAGFSFIASTVGGSSSGGPISSGGTGNTFLGATESGMATGGGSSGGGGSSYVASTGVIDSNFTPGSGSDISIMYSLVQPDGKILLAGGFTNYAGNSASRIVRINQDGTIDSSFNTGTGANTYIYGMALQPDGKIIITGQFTAFNGYSRNRIARLNPNGSVDTSFDIGSGPDNWIRSVYLLPNGKMIVAGYFININGSSYNRVARLNADGTLDTTFTTGVGPNGAANFVSVDSSGKIYLAGNFTACNGTTRNYICRLNSDGTLDTSFNPPSGLSGWPYIIIPQTDGKILVGGNFATCNGSACGNIVRLNQDGTNDTSFVSNVAANGYVYTIVPLPDGKLMLGGNFTTYNGTSRNYIARITDTGTLDTSFAPSSGANGLVNAIAPLSDGSMIVSGNFTTFNGVSLNRVARIK